MTSLSILASRANPAEQPASIRLEASISTTTNGLASIILRHTGECDALIKAAQEAKALLIKHALEAA